MKRTLLLWLGIAAFALAPALGQDALGKIHGRVTDLGGLAKTTGRVSLSQDGGKTNKYTFQVNATGDYTGEAKPGVYMVVFRLPDTPPDKIVDGFDGVKIVAGADVLQNIDMSRKEFMDRLTPDQRKQIEEYKNKNAEIMKANDSVKSLNADLAAVRADIKEKKFEEAEDLMIRDTAAKPDSALLWIELGAAEVGLKKYDEASKAFKTAINLDSTSQKPNSEVGGVANSGLGEIYARSGKIAEANAAFDAAAKAEPTKAAVYYSNQTIIFYQLYSAGAQGADFAAAQVDAANVAIKVSPNNALLYYLKGNGLVKKATVDPKTGRIVLPPGCAEAFQEYLALAPDGKFAADVKEILNNAGQKVSSGFKAGKK